MSEIKIDIQRTGFPVSIGTLDLWFDSSLENLRRFFNIDEIAQQKLKEAQEKAQHIHFPDEIEDIEDIDVRTVDAAFDVNKEFIAAQYDILFGDNTFKKIYKQYPDIVALEQALTPIGNAIAERIEGQEQERSSKVEEMKQEALKKQQLKSK
ncbi:hypothetical protein CHI07_17120 [Paenibacillus sp. 7884-2]|nr:hypothetical protein CHI07_17120 [Paenibacillus sp. 7884-2]